MARTLSKQDDSPAQNERHVAALVRVSTADQDIERQRPIILGIAEREFPGVRVIEYLDDGVSAYKHSIFDRPAGKEMTSAIERGDVSGVVADRHDRLSRGDTYEWAKFHRACKLASTRIITSEGEYKLDDAASEMMAIFRQWQARSESEEKSHRAKTRFALDRAKGRFKGGRVAKGYRRREDGVLEPTDDAKHVLAVFQAYANEVSLSDCVRIVKHHFNCNYDRASLKRHLLGNPTYIGKLPHNGSHVDGAHEPIVPLPLWERVQERLAREAGGRSYRDRALQPFGSLARCGVCGGAVVYSHSKRDRTAARREYGYFKCNDKCSSVSLPSELFDTFTVMGLHNAAILIPQRLAEPDTWTCLRPNPEKVSALEAELADLDERETRLVALVEQAGTEGGIAGERLREIAEAREQLTAEHAEATRTETERRKALDLLLRQFEAIRSPYGDDPYWVFNTWSTWSRQNRRLLLNTLVERIVLLPDSVTLHLRAGIKIPIAFDRKEDGRRDFSRGDASKCAKLQAVGFGVYEASAS